MKFPLFCLLLFLAGCSNKNSHEIKVGRHHVIHRKFEGIGIAIFHGLPFAKSVPYEDKLKLDESLQKALHERINSVWQGKCSQGKIVLLEYFDENGFECCKFSVNIMVDSKEYVITNKAAKINVDDKSSFWVLEDTIEHYRA